MAETDFLRVIAENTRDIISIFDADFKRYYISPSVFDITGYTREEILAMDTNMPIPPDDVQAVQPIILAALAEAKSCVVEHRLIHKNQSIIWVEVLIKPILDNTGRIVWILTSAREITDRKRQEKELDIERKLREQLYNISSLSHEIRTPLTTLMSALQLLKDGLGHEHATLVKTLHACGEMLIGMVENVLDFSRLSHGKAFLHQIDFDLFELCRNTTALYATAAEDKGLSMTLSIDPDLPQYVHGDPYKLNQIISNLLVNSIRYTRQGTIDFAVKKSAGDAIEFEVTDTGIGIPKEMTEKIFEPFVRHEGEWQQNSRGAGLGLAIVKTLVTMMKGEIKVESAVNRGSTFLVRLPLRNGASVSTPLRGNVSGMKILLVEDVATNQILFQTLLGNAGAVCVCVSEIDAAVDKIMSTAFDVILLDMHLGKDDSLALLTLMKNRGVSVPVIAFSADASDETYEKAIASGIRDYVIKTARFDTLTEVISRYRKTSMQDFDLQIYEGIRQVDKLGHRHALQLLDDDLYRFMCDFADAISKHDPTLMKNAVHRIRPVLKQIVYDRLLRILSDVELLIAESRWTEVAKLESQCIDMINRLRLAIGRGSVSGESLGDGK